MIAMARQVMRSAAAISAKAAPGSGAPKTAEPATSSVAPASAHGPAVLRVDAAVDLELGPGADDLAHAADPLERAGDERLAAPARVDGHAQREVELDLGEDGRRRAPG